MGLSINYTLQAPPGTDGTGARQIVRQLHQRAVRYQAAGRVDGVLPLGEDERALRHGRTWRFYPVPDRPRSSYDVELKPQAGIVSVVEVGADCEPLRLGLCQYPTLVWTGGEMRRTGLRGWRWEGFCKTQYASLHG